MAPGQVQILLGWRAQVQRCLPKGSRPNTVGEALSGQGPEAEELDLGLGNVVDQDQW